MYKLEDFITMHRPERFADFWGSDNIKSSLKKWLARGLYPRAILLVGDCGVGKTTLARLIAKRFTCLSQEKEEIEPCFKCVNCTQETPNNVEFDLTNSCVEGIRVYLRNYAVNLFTDRITLYFDELQRWNLKNQEIFLKPIEEMEDVHFIFSATNLDFVEEGILSRSTILQVAKPSAEEMILRLKPIADKYLIKITEGALKKLVRLSRNTPRKCLKAFNLLIDFGREITEETYDDEFIRKSIL